MQPVKFGSHSISHNEALRAHQGKRAAGSDASPLGDQIDRADISSSTSDGPALAKKPSFAKGEGVVESTRSAWRSLATAGMIAMAAAGLGGLTGCASVAQQHAQQTTQQPAPRDPAYEVGRELNKAGKEIGEAGKQIGLGAWEVGKSFWKGISGQPQEAPAKPAPPPAPPAKKR